MLRDFCWPIYIRLKENEATYQILFKGKMDNDTDSVNYKIARFVEKFILMKNHEVIVAITIKYRYLAETDSELEDLLKAYIRHVRIYKALLDNNINKYPGVELEAPFPSKIDAYFYNKTSQLQKKLEGMRF